MVLVIGASSGHIRAAVALVIAVATNNRKRAARTVLTGMCYSVGSATRQGEQFADPVYRPVGYD
ncbi:hypothetical protein Q5483_21180, partial [Escherichia coli]|nr:hypothetical protein [Escherichia coli]